MKYIGVIGGSSVSEDIYKLAFKVGELIAENGYILICGGKSGIMKAASKGAKSKNGITIGILPENNRESANEFIDYSISTGFGEARNMVIINSSDILIAINGKYGTLSEIALALNAGKKVITLNSKWNIEGTIQANSAKEALEIVESFRT